MQNYPENALMFVSEFNPEKKWQYRGIENDVLFF